jgi:dihydrofolate reductase
LLAGTVFNGSATPRERQADGTSGGVRVRHPGSRDGGSGGAKQFEHGGWAFKFQRGDEGDKYKVEELMAADALLLGRVTYNGFAAAWPKMNSDDFGRKMNSISKYVVSSTLTDPSWTNSTVISGEDLSAAMNRLKDEVGELLVAGSPKLAQALLRSGLVDELRLMVYPTVLGTSKRKVPDSSTLIWCIARRRARQAFSPTTGRIHELTGPARRGGCVR